MRLLIGNFGTKIHGRNLLMLSGLGIGRARIFYHRLVESSMIYTFVFFLFKILQKQFFNPLQVTGPPSPYIIWGASILKRKQSNCMWEYFVSRPILLRQEDGATSAGFPTKYIALRHTSKVASNPFLGTCINNKCCVPTCSA